MEEEYPDGAVRPNAPNEEEERPRKHKRSKHKKSKKKKRHSDEPDPDQPSEAGYDEEADLGNEATEIYEPSEGGRRATRSDSPAPHNSGQSPPHPYVEEYEDPTIPESQSRRQSPGTDEPWKPKTRQELDAWYTEYQNDLDEIDRGVWQDPDGLTREDVENRYAQWLEHFDSVDREQQLANPAELYRGLTIRQIEEHYYGTGIETSPQLLTRKNQKKKSRSRWWK